MAHLKNLVVNGNSRTIGTVYASNYVGKVNGYTIDINTNNTNDTWVPVITSGKMQHRVIPAAYNNDPSTLSVKYATTAGTANNVAWNNVSGKPSTYTPSGHTHNISDINNLQNTINSINSNKAEKTETITLGDGTDLPSSYTGGNIFKNP